MPRRSTREKKNDYLKSREEAGLTREAAAERLGFISADRLYRIESGASPDPEEVLRMAECYRKPSLCNAYCAKECRIGRVYVTELQAKDLSQITVELLATLNELNKDSERLLEIAVDGRVTEDEIPDFRSIQNALKRMSVTIDTLRLWVNQMIADRRIDAEAFGAGDPPSGSGIR